MNYKSSQSEHPYCRPSEILEDKMATGEFVHCNRIYAHISTITEENSQWKLENYFECRGFVKVRFLPDP
jgi:hypothetical protein